MSPIAAGLGGAFAAVAGSVGGSYAGELIRGPMRSRDTQTLDELIGAAVGAAIGAVIVANSEPKRAGTLSGPPLQFLGFP
jgi:uncharacterized protein YcfJ